MNDLILIFTQMKIKENIIQIGHIFRIILIQYL